VRRFGVVGLAMFCAALLGLAAREARAEGVVVVLGDSLSAGLGVAVDEAFPARLQARLRADGYDYRVVNAGVSGDTTAGGLRRTEYTKEFEAVFPEVARRAKVPLMPFLLDGVAADPRLNQPDGIHPTAAGQQLVADRLWPHLRPLLRPAK
jgi:acyl-CoA thioesterase I